MEKKQCPFCGKTVLAISKACKHCGKSFEQNVQNEIPQQATVPPLVEPQRPVAQQSPYNQQQSPYSQQQSPYNQQQSASPANNYNAGNAYYNTGNNYSNPNMPPSKPDNYLVFAILLTIFCCIPVGIVSIIYASQVNDAYNAGDYAKAQTASDNAKKWLIWTVVAGVIFYVILMLIGYAA